MNLRDPEQLGLALSAYLDGELSPEETARVEHVLATSPEARRQLDALRQVVSQVSALPRTSAPADLLGRVRDSLAHPSGTHLRRLPRGYRWGLGLAAAVATIAVLTRFASVPAPVAGPSEQVALAPPRQPAIVDAPAPSRSEEPVTATRGTRSTALSAPAIARAEKSEMARLQQLGYVGGESDEEDLTAMLEAGVAARSEREGDALRRNDARIVAGRAAGTPTVGTSLQSEPLADGAGVGRDADDGRQVASAGTQLRVRVNTSSPAQFERLQSWADGLEPKQQAPGVGGQLLLSPDDVAGVLDVLATEEAADVDLEMRFRAADIRGLRAAFQEPTIAYLPPPPAEVADDIRKPAGWPVDVFAQRHRKGRAADQAAPASPAAPVTTTASRAEPVASNVLGQFGADLIALRPMLVGPPVPRPVAPIAVDLQILPPTSTRPAGE